MSLDAVHRASWVATDRKVESAVSRSLHDTAQPLTVLQGLLELMLQGKIATEHKGTVIHAIEQLRRVSNGFDHLRRLIRLQEPAEDVVETTASSLVKDVLQELRSSFVASGVKCVAGAGRAQFGEHIPEPAVHVSRSRTTMAFRLVLTSILSRMQRGDSLSVWIEPMKKDVVVRVLPETNGSPLGPRNPDRTESAAMSARLDLARALVASTGGELRSGRVPCSMDMLLPRGTEEPASTTIEKKTRSMHV